MVIDTTHNSINEAITLISDKIDKYCAMSRWPQPKGRHIWDFDRIARLIYSKMYHGSKENFDHSISVRWKKPKGKGTNDPGILKDIMMEHEGVYHYPCDFGFHIHLWHPDSQSFQEAAPPSSSSERMHWRSIYEFSEDEVWSGLDILCKHYEWDLERGEDSKWVTLGCEHGSCTYG